MSQLELAGSQAREQAALDDVGKSEAAATALQQRLDASEKARVEQARAAALADAEAAEADGGATEPNARLKARLALTSTERNSEVRTERNALSCLYYGAQC